MNKFSVLSLFVCVLLLGAFASTSSAVELMIAPSGDPSGVSNLDSEQPDTIKYDIGGYYFLYGPTDVYSIVRFTAPSDFELRCIYLQMFNPNNNGDGVNVGIYSDDTGQPSSLISGPYHFGGPLWTPTNPWLDVELNQPFPALQAGEEFYVIWGPAPTGTQTQGWFIYLDSNGNTDSRSGYGSASTGPWQYDIPGDLICRAGGEVDAYTDLTVNYCFNDVQKYFFDLNEPVVYQAEVQNVGTNDVDSYQVVWKVYDSENVQVFADSAEFTTITSGEVQIVDCPTEWSATVAGYYVAEAVVEADNDLVVDNNDAVLEQGIGPRGFDWLTYDDGTSTIGVSSSAGNGWGQKFTPSSYPVKIDSIKVGLTGAIPTSNVTIVNFRGTTMETLGTYTGALVDTVNTIDVSALDMNVFEGQIGIGYMYQDPGSIMKDDTPPLAAPNAQMPSTAFQIQGGSWIAFDAGDWMLSVFCSPSSALPPYPIIRTTPDTVMFGDVMVTETGQQSFWVHNDGGEDLEVTNIFVSGSLTDFDFDMTAFTVGALDSQEVVMTWTPADTGYVYANIVIQNNDTAPYPVFIPFNGTAIPLGVIPTSGIKPVTYELTGNYPNPFNNQTRFSFSLPNAEEVSFKIFDVRGQLVATLAEGYMPVGQYEVTFNASDLASGVYLYQLEAGDFLRNGKMVLLK